ncbi:hypothetical protein FVER53590_25714 [Fusarium verticillioides]|nr:hypothetical protein FVER53590_25714 [Fusarium verticillioides]
MYVVSLIFLTCRAFSTYCQCVVILLYRSLDHNPVSTEKPAIFFTHAFASPFNFSSAALSAQPAAHHVLQNAMYNYLQEAWDFTSCLSCRLLY